MRRHSEEAIFWLTAASAAASLVSVAAMEILLAAALLLWIIARPVSPRWPPYTLPLAVFAVITTVSLLLSPDPGEGRHAIQKFVLYSMGILTATFVTTEDRAAKSYRLLLVVTAISAVIAIVQFIGAETLFLRTGELADDPTLVKRITGPLGHWMTFSGVQLLVWSAGVPAIVFLGKKWIVPVITAGIAIVLSNTRGAWLGAAAAFAFVAWALPRRVIAVVVISLAIVSLAASPLIFRRITMSLDTSLATNYSRAVYFEVGARIIKDHPLFGVGPERIHDEFPHYYTGNALETFYYGHLHNNFLQIAAERGLICLAAFVWLLLELYRSLVRLFRISQNTVSWVVLGSLGALTGFVVAGMTEYNFGDSEVLVLLLFLVSIPFGLTTHVQEDPDSQPG